MNQVEKRIKELIRLDRYLNPKEKEIYPQWLEKQEERRAELAEEQRNREILSSAPPENNTAVSKSFEYNGYHFEPTGILSAGRTLKEISNETISNNTLGMSAYEGATHPYSYEEFYNAANSSSADIFKCVENGRLYIPGENELFEYTGNFNPILSIEQSETPENSAYAYHLGDTVYMGADEYEILSFNDERVVLHDVQFPLFQKEMDRAEFDRKVRENPMNDHLKVKELPSEEKTDEAPAFDIGMGYLGNGLTVWNRAVEESGDYQTIAHISDEGEIHYYVDGLPEDVVARIEQAAAQEQQKSLFAASYQVGDRVYLDGKPFEITRVDDWNVELMDRSEQNPQPRLESKDNFMQLVQQNERSNRFTDAYREYGEIKEENPDSLVLYQVGDFFEAYGADAQTVSEALELNLTSRFIGNNQRTQMCGFPANRLETYINMLLDRGFDVAVSAAENGERNTRNIVSSNKEDPVQSQPVGRIEYLDEDGNIIHTDEYTSEYQFKKDIEEESSFGTRLRFYVYRDAEGKTIDQTFITKQDTPLNVYEIIDSPYLVKDRTENALPPDERFFVIETDEGYAIWDDLTEAIYIDDEGVSEEFKSEWQANDYLEQVKKSVSEKEAAGQLEPEQKGAKPLTPAFVQPKRSRVQTFDLHPEIPLSERHTFDLASHEVPEAGKKRTLP